MSGVKQLSLMALDGRRAMPQINGCRNCLIEPSGSHGQVLGTGAQCPGFDFWRVCCRGASKHDEISVLTVTLSFQ